MFGYENNFNNLNNENEEKKSEAVDVSYEEVKAQEPNKPEPTPYYTNSNEYVFSPEVAPKKSSNGGKVALLVIAVILGIFVVSVSSISAFVAFTGFQTTVEEDIDNVVIGTQSPEENNDASIPGSVDGTSDSSETQTTTEKVQPTPIREFPTLEQLAAPDDALSLPEIYNKVSPSVVGVSCKLSRSTTTGTGIIFSKDGYILTNAHVVDGAETITIVDYNMNEYEATLIGADSQTDLAVLKIESADLVPCEFGISADLQIGELVVAIGNPLGFDLFGSMTNGIISGLNRTISIGENEMTLLQTNASINNGNSGGPLIDAYGRVIGITSAKVASTYGEGLGFAIPIDEALPIVNDLIAYGYVTGRPMIGVTGEDITAIMSMYYRLPQGVYVRFIEPDSAAHVAGIKAGDIIIGIQGEAITSMDELNAIKNNYSAGDTVVLTIYRDGKNIEINLTLGEATTNE